MDDADDTKVDFTFYFKFYSHFYRHRKHSSNRPFYSMMSVVFIGFFIVNVYALKYIHITHILPIGSSGITSITKGIAPAIFSFQGFEFLLILHPFVKATPRNIIKATSIANIFIT